MLHYDEAPVRPRSRRKDSAILKLLVVDDDATFRGQVVERVKKLHPELLELREAGDIVSALAAIDEAAFDLVLLDAVLPRQQGEPPTARGAPKILSHLAEHRPTTAVVLISSQDTQAAADLILQHRISDYVSKASPWESIVARIEQNWSVVERERRSASTGETPPTFLATRNEAMAEVLRQLKLAASEDTTVLLLGESGVGKEIAARFIHDGSPRARAPFVAVNCATLHDDLMGSEMFGHARGAFTGADSARAGKFELAAGGTLFLDEVAELSARSQAALLRVIQERQIQRVGENRKISVDVRLISATNKDLQHECEVGSFRRDLFFRIGVFPVEIPPLRRRPEDILPLADYFLARCKERMRRRAAAFSEEARAVLAGYSWPGNVREMANLVERLVILEPSDTIQAGTTRAALPPRGEMAPAPLGYEEERLLFERNFWSRILDQSGGNISEASRLSGLPRGTLYDKLKACGLR